MTDITNDLVFLTIFSLLLVSAVVVASAADKRAAARAANGRAFARLIGARRRERRPR